MNNNSTANNLALTERRYEETAYTFVDSNLDSNNSYADSSLNFFGVSSGLIYVNLDTTTFENC